MQNERNTLSNQTMNDLLNNDFPNHMLYEKYKNMGQSSLLIFPAVLLNLIGIPGITANLLLIYVTIKDKKLRGPTNYLLALTAFFEILHQSSHLLFLFVTVTGINFINYSTALMFQLHSIFGITAAQTLMCSTAVDRLLSFLIPIKYVKFNIHLYMSSHIFLAIASGIWMSINAIIFASKYPTLPVTGHISDLFVLDMGIIFPFIMFSCLLNATIYLLVWMAVCCFHSGNNESFISANNQSRLLKSLILIVSIVIGGYIFNSINHQIIIPLFNLNDIQIWLFGAIGGILVNIGASSETPILYIFSNIYREAFNKQLKQIFCKKNQNNVITVVPPNVNYIGRMLSKEKQKD